MNKNQIRNIIDISEKFFAVVVILGVCYFSIISAYSFTQMDWTSIETFYEFISRVLILVVGLELAKLLITHDIYAISALLVFVVARKVLLPDLSSLDILFSILAFAVLFILNARFSTKKLDK